MDGATPKHARGGRFGLRSHTSSSNQRQPGGKRAARGGHEDASDDSPSSSTLVTASASCGDSFENAYSPWGATGSVRCKPKSEADCNAPQSWRAFAATSGGRSAWRAVGTGGSGVWEHLRGERGGEHLVFGTSLAPPRAASTGSPVRRASRARPRPVRPAWRPGGIHA